LFFSVLFDKLIIIPADDLSPPSDNNDNKRSVPAADIGRRNMGYWGDNYLSVGDKPWYCYWNSTVNEFWVFLDGEMPDANQTAAPSANATTSYGSHPTTSTAHSTTYPSPSMYGVSTTSNVPSMTTSFPAEPTIAAPWPGSTYAKRQASVGSTNFPKKVKMVEKRKPADNVSPYCQQMQVLNNWQIMPIPDVPIIEIAETDYSQDAATGNSRMMRKRGDTVQELGSNCICEWFSI